jgi:hypothetical protein
MSEPREFSEEELRQIEAEMERISVDDVLLQTLVTLLNLAARKAGLAAPPGQEGAPAPDLEQMGQAIEGARVLLPLVEKRHADQLGPVRDTLSQLQMAYSQLARGARGPAADAPQAEEAKEEGAGPAQSSGRLWVPGQ